MKISLIARGIGGAALFLGTFAAGRVAADEVVLKDGKKITGTVVGFENGMFKVETEFGFALVRKDRVVTINITSGSEKLPPAKTEKSEKKEAPPKIEATVPSDKPIEAAKPVAAAPPPVPPR